MKKEKKFMIPEAEFVILFNIDTIRVSDVDSGNDDEDLPPYPNN